MAGTYTPGKGGMTLKRGANVIPQVRSITVYDLDMPEVDNTHLASIAQESAPTLPNNGGVAFEFLYNPSNTEHQNIISDYKAGTVSSWTVTLADAGAATIAGNAWVKSLRANGLDARGSLIISGMLRWQEDFTVTP